MALERLGNPALAFYNGHTFSGAAETIDCRVTPVFDQAGRTVIYSVYSITIKEYIAPSPAPPLAGVPVVSQAITAGVVADTVAKLSRPAGVFKYQGRGFGDLNINVGGGKTFDVVWGPKTRVISLKPNGGLTVELIVTIEVAIPNCDDATFKFALMEFNYTVSFDKDREGYSTRVYSGFLRIPQTRTTVDARGLTDTADAYLEKIYPDLLTGFRRTPGTWKLSEDKCRVDFQIIDTQMAPNAPPAYIIDCQAEHAYHSQSLAEWTGTLSATYTLDRAGGTATHAIVAFMALLQSKMGYASAIPKGAGLPAGPPVVVAADAGGGRARGGLLGAGIGFAFGGLIGAGVGAVAGRFIGGAGGAPAAPAAPAFAFVRSASASEPDIYGRTQARLSATYTVARGVGFTEIFVNGGMWRPIPEAAGGVWGSWAASLTPPKGSTTLGARGHANLVFKPNEDAIVDLCGPGAPQEPSQQPASQNVQQAFTNALIGALPSPTPQNSWLDYKCAITIHTETGRVVVSTLPTSPLSAAGSNSQSTWNVLNGVPTTSTANSPFPPLAGLLNSSQDQAGGETLVQQRTRPKLYVTITGEARACALRTRSEVISYGDATEDTQGTVAATRYPVTTS